MKFKGYCIPWLWLSHISCLVGISRITAQTMLCTRKLKAEHSDPDRCKPKQIAHVEGESGTDRSFTTVTDDEESFVRRDAGGPAADEGVFHARDAGGPARRQPVVVNQPPAPAGFQKRKTLQA